MADGGSSAACWGEKKVPQTEEDEGNLRDYNEATDFAIDNFQNISVREAKDRPHICVESSQSSDFKPCSPICQGSVIGIEDDDTGSIIGIEDDETIADGTEDDAWSWNNTDCDEMLLPRVDDRNMDIMRPDLTWEQMVLKVLNMIRCRELTEYNHKLQISVPTRFCLFNIALFDLDEESKIEPRPLFRDIPASDYWKLENSVNVISIKVSVSDVGYPVNIFGTVLARDEVDYRCVYLFNRGRDNPQRITSPVDTLTLTGPGRALSVTDSMFFEFNLKIKDDGAVDKEFCKGLLEHNTACDTIQPMSLTLESWLSTVELAFTLVPFAIEASLTVSILKGPSTFIGKIVASTTANDKNKIILYDSQVAGTQTKLGTDGSIVLTRYIVAVPLDEDLVLNVSLCGSDCEAERLELIIGNDVEKCTNTLGPYELQVKLVWRGLVKQRRPNMWEYFGDVRVLR